MKPNPFGLPRVDLAVLPTPFEEVPRFSKALGGPRVFVKRDDLTGLALGGNKARKLEYLMGEAVSRGALSVVTCGGPQSNHARMTAAAARKFGLHPVLVLDGDDPGQRQGNLLLDEILGAELVFSGSTSAEEKMVQVFQDLEGRGMRPYLIPLGGSSALGTVGYIECVREIIESSHFLGVQPSWLYVPAGSCGTVAGLVLGAELYEAPFQVCGIAVSPDAAKKEKRTVELVLEAASLILRSVRNPQSPLGPCPLTDQALQKLSGLSETAVRKRFRIIDGFVGQGYGIPTPEGVEAIRLLARTEGILTDPVYTGKALAALVHHVRSGNIPAESQVIFLHTGGTPADFAYSEELVKGRA